MKKETMIINIKTGSQTKVNTQESKLENLLGKVESDIRENKNISKTFSTKKEVEDYLLSL